MENKINDLRLPELPELTAGYLVVQKEAWEILTNYIKAQTSTINALIDTVESLTRLHDIRATSVNLQIKTLGSEVADIAQALEGAYIDE
jgi:hypothetical protein